MSVTLTKVSAELRSFLRSADPQCTSTADAASVVALGAEIERLGSAVKTLFAARAAESSVWREAGHRSAASWLATTAGTGLGDAIGTLETAAQLTTLPETTGALRTGQLSGPQLREIASTASRRPSTESTLLQSASHNSLKGLKDQCRKLRASTDPESTAATRYEVIRKARHFRHWTDEDGAVCFLGKTTADDGARLVGAVEARSNELFDEARKAGRHEPVGAYAVDALVDLVSGPRRSTSAGRDASSIVIHVDGAALRRGKVAPGETCEIAGVGPVPLATVNRELPEAFIKILVEDGVDVTTVCHAGRTISSHILSALETRDQRCVVDGCDVAHGLEAHHIVPFAQGGPSSLANLVRLCGFHHYLVTHKGFEVNGKPGSWKWLPSPGHSAKGDRELTDEEIQTMCDEADERRALFDGY